MVSHFWAYLPVLQWGHGDEAVEEAHFIFGTLHFGDASMGPRR